MGEDVPNDRRLGPPAAAAASVLPSSPADPPPGIGASTGIRGYSRRGLEWMAAQDSSSNQGAMSRGSISSMPASSARNLSDAIGTSTCTGAEADIALYCVFYSPSLEPSAHHFLALSMSRGGMCYVYRGNIPFCSEECRLEQIEFDEARKSRNLSMRAPALRKEYKKKSSQGTDARAPGTVVAG